MLNQYHVDLEVDPKFQYGPEALNGIYVRSSTGQQMAQMADPSVVQTQKKFRLGYKQAYAWTMIEVNFRSRITHGQFYARFAYTFWGSNRG